MLFRPQDHSANQFLLWKVQEQCLKNIIYQRQKPFHPIFCGSLCGSVLPVTEQPENNAPVWRRTMSTWRLRQRAAVFLFHKSDSLLPRWNVEWTKQQSQEVETRTNWYPGRELKAEILFVRACVSGMRWRSCQNEEPPWDYHGSCSSTYSALPLHSNIIFLNEPNNELILIVPLYSQHFWNFMHTWLQGETANPNNKWFNDL